MDYNAKRKALAEFYTEAVKNPDQPIQFNYMVGGWGDESHGPDLGSDLTRWRVKPMTQKVYVVWLNCDWIVRGHLTSAPSFSNLEDAESWNNEHADGKGKIQELVRPD